MYKTCDGEKNYNTIALSSLTWFIVCFLSISVYSFQCSGGERESVTITVHNCDLWGARLFLNYKYDDLNITYFSVVKFLTSNEALLTWVNGFI